MKLRLLSSLGALLAAAGLAAAPGHAAPLPTYEPGVAFIYDTGRVEQVAAVSGDTVTWAARSGRRYTRAVNPVTPILAWSFRGESGSRRIVGRPDALWPLAAGRTARFRTLNETRSDKTGKIRRSVHLWRCAVRAAEPVTTPAGTFEAFPIICDRYSPNTMRVLERLTWRYAPEVGHHVQREARDMRTGEADLHSLAVALPAWEANRARIETLARQAERANRKAQ